MVLFYRKSHPGGTLVTTYHTAVGYLRLREVGLGWRALSHYKSRKGTGPPTLTACEALCSAYDNTLLVFIRSVLTLHVGYQTSRQACVWLRTKSKWEE